MGTVGINFGAASSGQGFDVASTVTQILGAEQAIESPWKSQLTSLAAQDVALTTLGTNLSTLTTSLQALTDFSGILAQKQGSSSNTNVLQLTGATSSAIAGNHSVFIQNLAQTSSNYSSVVANAPDAISGSVTIQVGSGTAQTVTVNSSSNSLSSFDGDQRGCHRRERVGHHRRVGVAALTGQRHWRLRRTAHRQQLPERYDERKRHCLSGRSAWAKRNSAGGWNRG